MTDSSFYIPSVPWPNQVRAIVTTRFGGVSIGGKESFNLASHVNDDSTAVANNRRELFKKLGKFTGETLDIHWLQQVHECRMANLSTELCTGQLDEGVEIAEPADGAFSSRSHQACTVLTADCMPILMSSLDGKSVAAAHAGWRGLASGILLDSLLTFSVRDASKSNLHPVDKPLVYLGPAISAKNYEVGAEVKTQVMALAPFIAEKLSKISVGDHGVSVEKTVRDYRAIVGSCFYKNEAPEKYQFDLYGLAKGQLRLAGLDRIYGGNYCTFDDERWYSHRENPESGRFASLIWRTA